MALDSFRRKSIDRSKSLEQRAKDNGRAIDDQWIKENEGNELYSSKKYTQTPKGVNNSTNLTPMPGGLDPDLQAKLEHDLQELLDHELQVSSDYNLQERLNEFGSLTNPPTIEERKEKPTLSEDEQDIFEALEELLSQHQKEREEKEKERRGPRR